MKCHLKTLLILITIALTIVQPKSIRAEENADESGCTSAAPQAALLPNAYKNQSFKTGKDNQATETATIDKNVHLKIEYAGCVDGVSQELTFTTPAPAGQKRDIAYWIGWAKDNISKLKVDKDRGYFIPAIEQFLSNAPTYKHQDGEIKVCFDGSAPTELGCSFETGGSYFFEVKPNGPNIEVIVGQATYI